MLLSESDLTIVSAVTASGSFLTNQSVRAIAQRLQSEEGTSAAVRSNFIVDSSTPHGDAMIVDRSVMKPALGWVTAHTTESLRSGLHEWCIKVEHQGETSDGSGLMLGIVPKSFSRFDSFISQGGGWCLSRAGKFYGHWRRVDTNTSVSSLTFGTGDRVIFELDLDANRMTVRVGEKFVTGEISNLSGEVYPAVSLHYRHQSVKFEYHKVHDRSKKKANWVDRGCFPSAACFLPLTTPKEILQLPLPHYLFSKALTAGPEDGGLRSAGASGGSLQGSSQLESFALKVLMVSRAVAMFQRMLSVTATGPKAATSATAQLIHTSIEELRRVAQHQGASAAFQTLLQAYLPMGGTSILQQPSMLGGLPSVASSFAGDCGAVLMLQAVAQQSAATPMVLGALPLIVQFLAKGEPFSLSEVSPEQGRSISTETTQAIADRVYAMLTPSLSSAELPKELRPSAIELLVALAIQRGSVSDAVRAVRLLLSLSDELPNATISAGTSQWLRQLCITLRPSRQLLPMGAALDRLLLSSAAISSAVPSSPTAKEPAQADEMFSICCDSERVYMHGAKGIKYWDRSSDKEGGVVRLAAVNSKDLSEALPANSKIVDPQWTRASSMCCDDTYLYWAPVKVDTKPSEPEDGHGRAEDISANPTSAFIDNVLILYFDKKTLKLAGTIPGSSMLGELSSTLTGISCDPEAGSAGWKIRLLDSYQGPSAKANGSMLAVQHGVRGQVAVCHIPQPGSKLASIQPMHLIPSLPTLSYHHALSFSPSTKVTLLNNLTLKASEQTAPRGQLTIELWFRLTGRCEPQVILKCGDRTQQGELFIDLAIQDGAMCVRGGYRHDTRGAQIVSLPIPPAAGGMFHHVALTYDGRWRLLLDGNSEVVARAAQQPSMEKPLAGLQLGGGFTGLLAELRMWRTARTSFEISRDCHQALYGSEAGLWLHWPLCEPEGVLAYDHSTSGFHGGVRRSDDSALPARQHLPAPCVSKSVFRFAANEGSSTKTIAVGQALIPNLEETSFTWDKTRSVLLIRSEGILHAHQLVIGRESSDGQPSLSLVDAHVTQLIESRPEAPKSSPALANANALQGQGSITIIECGAGNMLAVVSRNGTGGEAPEEPTGSGGLTLFTFASVPCPIRSPLEVLLTTRPDWAEMGKPLSLPTVAYTLMLLMEYSGERFGVPTYHHGARPVSTASPLLGRMFLPFVNDVSVDCLWSIVGLVRDHFRLLQVRNAPKTHNLRHSEISVPVLGCALRCLDSQIEAATRNKIHPSVLELEIADELLVVGSLSSPLLAASLSASVSGTDPNATPVRQSSRLASGAVYHSPTLQQQMGQTLQQALSGTGQATTARAVFGDSDSDTNGPTKTPPRLGQYILATLSDLVQASSTLHLPADLTSLATAIISRCIPHHYVHPSRRASLLLSQLRGQSPPPQPSGKNSKERVVVAADGLPLFLTSPTASPALIIGLIESISDVESCIALYQEETPALLDRLITTLCQVSKVTTISLLKGVGDAGGGP